MDSPPPKRARRAVKKQTKVVCNECSKCLTIGPLLKHLKTHTNGTQERVLVCMRHKRSKTPCRILGLLPKVTGNELYDIAYKWVDCCGHLAGTSLKSISSVDQVAEGRDYDFEYDQSPLVVSFIGTIKVQNSVPDKSIVIAESKLPDETCCMCDEMATLYCSQCALDSIQNGEYEVLKKSLFCGECYDEKHTGEDSECKGDETKQVLDDKLKSWLNNPRLGCCGYY